MQTLVFDIESDGLIPEMTKVHSLVIKDIDSGKVWSCHDEGGAVYEAITDGLELLMDAECISGHNIQDFDIQIGRAHV